MKPKWIKDMAEDTTSTSETASETTSDISSKDTKPEETLDKSRISVILENSGFEDEIEG